MPSLPISTKRRKTCWTIPTINLDILTAGVAFGTGSGLKQIIQYKTNPLKNLIPIFISITLLVQGCKAQTKVMENQEIIIPEIDNSFEKFDLESFQKERKGKKKKKKEKGIFIEEDSFTTGFITRIYYDSLYFKYNKIFYKNLKIKEKGIIFNNGSQYGIWYEFNEQGELIREINTDEGYDFGWEQVILYCIENKIELAKGYETSGFQTTIYKEKNEQGANVWVITYQIAGDQLLELTLDGKTGEELNRKELEFINP